MVAKIWKNCLQYENNGCSKLEDGEDSLSGGWDKICKKCNDFIEIPRSPAQDQIDAIRKKLEFTGERVTILEKHDYENRKKFDEHLYSHSNLVHELLVRVSMLEGEVKKLKEGKQ